MHVVNFDALVVGALACGLVGVSGRDSPQRTHDGRRGRGTFSGPLPKRNNGGTGWATRTDLRELSMRRPTSGRLILGRAGSRTASRAGSRAASRAGRGLAARFRGRLVAAEKSQSVLVIGPTQSRKTTGFAIPAILEWDGPVLATSVKSDLIATTIGWRRTQGTAWVYDPTGCTRTTGVERARWSPLDQVNDWSSARRTASSLAEVARSSAGTLTDGDFWYATAAKLLAPVLLAARVSGRSMAEVVTWIDEQQVDEVETALQQASEWKALQAARATWARDDRQRSAVYTTAETVVEAFADPWVAESARTKWDPNAVSPRSLLTGTNTLYLCAPAHDQRRLRPLFATLAGSVIEAAYELSSSRGRPIDPPLLVVIDEAANVAPLGELDVLASTAAGHGVQIVTVWQDMAQITARYGPRGNTIVNNHRVKVFLSGISDPATLEHASQLAGEVDVQVRSSTHDGSGRTSTTTAPVARRLLAPDALRRIRPGTGVVVSGHLPPVRVALRPWYSDPVLKARAEVSSEP